MWTKEARIQHAPHEGRYPSDVTDAEWAIIAPMIPPPRQGGRHRETNMRDVLPDLHDASDLDCLLYGATSTSSERSLP